MDLLTELVKAQDNLQDISFTFADKEYKWYFRYLTLLEKVRIEQMCTKLETTINTDGTTTNTYVKKDHLMPISTIIEKALDEDGKRLFSHVKTEHFKTISMLPAGLASMIAYQMSRDIFGTLTPKAEDGK